MHFVFFIVFFFFFQAEDGIRDLYVTGVQTCALPIYDADRDACVPRHDFGLDVRVPHPVGTATMYSPGRPPRDVAVSDAGPRVHIVLPGLVTYAVVQLKAVPTV